MYVLRWPQKFHRRCLFTFHAVQVKPNSHTGTEDKQDFFLRITARFPLNKFGIWLISTKLSAISCKLKRTNYAFHQWKYTNFGILCLIKVATLNVKVSYPTYPVYQKDTVIPRLTKIISFVVTFVAEIFVSRNVISRRFL